MLTDGQRNGKVGRLGNDSLVAVEGVGPESAVHSVLLEWRHGCKDVRART